MIGYDPRSLETLAAPARDMFEQWISFFPTAPLFGVKWRFADSFDMTAFSNQAGPATTTADEPAAEEPVAPTPYAGRIVPDDQDGGPVEQIRGIGPGLAAELNRQGIQSISQLAALSDHDLALIDGRLTAFKGRCFRDDWVGQARALLKGR